MLCQPVILRYATAQEAAEIAELVVAAYGEYQPLIADIHWRALKINLRLAGEVRGAKKIVACHEGICGFVAYYPPGNSPPTLFPEHWASIRLLAVAPELRGYGIGRRLTAFCIEQARLDGAQMIGLHTSELMTRAARMYESMGFAVSRKLEPMYGLNYWQYKLDLIQHSSAAKGKLRQAEQQTQC